MYKLKSLQEHCNHLDTLDTVDQIKNREKCIHTILESLDNQADYNTVDQIMVNELFGIGKLLKRVFVNPGVRRKIRKLVDELVTVRVEMIKTQLDENPDYVEDVINDEEKTRKAYDVKVETLQQQQEAIEQKMDALAGGDERLEKYVNLQKIEARMKANKLIIKVADKTTKKLLKDYDKEAGKEAKELADDLMESILKTYEKAPRVNEDASLPSQHAIGGPCNIEIPELNCKIPGWIRTVTHTNAKVRYSIIIEINLGPDEKGYTTFHNIDSVFVTPRKGKNLEFDYADNYS